MKLPIVGEIHIEESWKLIVGFLSILYIISPIDFIPDVIPIVGWIDDLVVGIFGVLPMFRSALKKMT